MSRHRSIHWFRKGLRLHDNPAFMKACEHATELYPVFVLDPSFTSSTTVGINRWRFLLQCLEDLDDSLKSLNLRLFVVKGKPEIVLKALCQQWSITRLTFEADTEPYAVERDNIVERNMEELSVEVVKCVSHTLYDVYGTVKANGGKAPLTYQGLQQVLGKLGPPKKAIPAPATNDLADCKTPISSTHNQDFRVPQLCDLNKSDSDCGPLLYPGGEKEALDRMEVFLKKVNWVCTFEKPKTEPNSINPSTTVLSPYLKFGCLSPRLFYHRLADVYRGKKHSQPPVSLHGQLLWREFFYTVGAVTTDFDKMKGNPVCRQIPWDTNQELLNCWTYAKTGYPFIDAIMTQLRLEGWIHHLARHAVACFLTRGDLWISWEEGKKVFEELLLDADWSLNAGNWLWLSASAFYHQYFRVYSPISFGKKTDPNGEYIKKYVPVLKKFPAKYIYEPWTAPLVVQQKAECIIGTDYPKPVVDHKVALQANMAKMQLAYASSKGVGSVQKVSAMSKPSAKTSKMDAQKRTGSGASSINSLKKSRK